MTTAAATAPDTATDPLKTIANAMENTTEAIEDGAVKLGEAMPKTRRFLGRFLYSAFYFTSYGLVFPTLFVANVVPGLGSMADGIVEGANAANNAINERKARRAKRREERAAKKAAAHDPDEQRVTQEGVECLAGA
jgi:hypothetical protein